MTEESDSAQGAQICSTCKCEHTIDNKVEWRTDPYAEEIKQDYTEMWLCESCANESARDI